MALNPNVVIVNPGDLITATHLNNVRANLDRLDTGKVNKAGDTMTGPLNGTAVSVTGSLVAGVNVNATGLISAGSSVTAAGFVRSGGDPAAADGAQLSQSGQILSTIIGSGGVVSAVINRSAAAAGETYVQFRRGAAEIGTIKAATISTVAYNTSSDERLKHDDGDPVDAAERVRRLGARVYRGRWLDDTGQPAGDTWDLLNAHDVADVAPYLVDGERGAVDAAGNIVPQQVNLPGLVPLLAAALADALDQIAELRVIVEDLT